VREITDQIASCTECEDCLEVCPTYEVTGEILFSPMHRLKTARKVLEGQEVDQSLVESLYNCPKCMRCETVCPEEIAITEVVSKSRSELVKRGLGPLDRHKKVIEGILARGNAVNGDPQKRLEWLPEEFPRRESDTLLYMGCLPSYLVKDAAASSYLVLKKLGFDFMLLEDEGCCGTYIYEAGEVDLARQYFQKNVERFKALGIRRIVVPCNGCLKCFKYFYPELLGETGFSVYHIAEILYDLLKENPALLKKVGRTITYHDSCRLARGEGVTEEPREILRWCGVEIKETARNRQETICCGAGAGIRSVYRDLSMEIASSFLKTVEVESIVSACPFCTFNLNYTSRKRELGKTTTYFTNLVLDSLR